MKQRINALAKRKSIREIIKYGMVGVTGLVIDIGIFYLLSKKFTVHYPFSVHIGELLGNKMSIHLIDTNISHVISSIIAVTNNFILNSYFTFKVTDNKLKRFLYFSGIAGIGLLISTTLITVFIGKLGLDEMIAKVSAVLIVASMQFAINKFFTFRKR